MTSKNNGTIFISIPHKLLDVGYFHKCTTSDWVALHDGREIYPLEQKIKQQGRILEVPFKKDVKEIEIIGNNLLSTSETYGFQCFNKFQKEMNPREQFANGFSLEKIICKNNLIIVHRDDGSSACVKPSTVQKLIERGWAKSG